MNLEGHKKAKEKREIKKQERNETGFSKASVQRKDQWQTHYVNRREDAQQQFKRNNLLLARKTLHLLTAMQSMKALDWFPQRGKKGESPDIDQTGQEVVKGGDAKTSTDVETGIIKNIFYLVY